MQAVQAVQAACSASAEEAARRGAEQPVQTTGEPQSSPNAINPPDMGTNSKHREAAGQHPQARAVRRPNGRVRDPGLGWWREAKIAVGFEDGPRVPLGAR